MARPKQLTLATQTDAGFERHRKASRRDVVLADIVDEVMPWGRLCAVVAPYYPKAPKRGDHQPIGLGRILCIHPLQQ